MRVDASPPVLAIIDASRSDQLTALVDSARNGGRLALDTESDPYHRYFEKVCLLQISTIEHDFVLDPLPGGLAPELLSLLEDPSRTWVLHGADYDVRSLFRAFQVRLGRIFDTLIAAQLLGDKALGLKALVEKELGLVLDKSEQRSDWGRRPLTQEQLDYAARDTRYLIPLAAVLEARLADKGRLAWMEEECAELRLKEPVERRFDPEDFLKIQGARLLAPLGRRVARGLFTWREARAKDRDVPPFRILPNPLIVEIARRIERAQGLERAGIEQWKKINQVVDVATLSAAISEAIERDLEPPSEAPSATKRPTIDHALWKKRLDALRAVRATYAEMLGLDPGFLLPGHALEKLAREPPGDVAALTGVRGLSRWRIETLGAALVTASDVE